MPPGAIAMDARGLAVFAWGVGGVVLLLVEAIVRLAPIAAGVLDGTLTALHWLAAAAWSAFMLYTEAWRGFHLRFAPRAVVRALAIARERRPWQVALAPLIAMCLVHATRRRLVANWLLVAMIVGLIVWIRTLPPPWRAIVDLGVVLGLTGGTASLLVHAGRALAGRPPDVAPDFPPPR